MADTREWVFYDKYDDSDRFDFVSLHAVNSDGSDDPIGMFFDKDIAEQVVAEHAARIPESGHPAPVTAHPRATT